MQQQGPVQTEAEYQGKFGQTNPADNQAPGPVTTQPATVDPTAPTSPPRQPPPAAQPGGFPGVATPQYGNVGLPGVPTVGMPQAPQAGQVGLPQAPESYQVERPDFERPDIDYSQFDPHTRDVGQQELVSSQMQQLLDSESPYMQQALLAGQRQAASRGLLSSSMAAGAAQAAAIQAALPIAAADAQTYSRVASENAAAINQINIAKLQSTTQMASTIVQASAAMAQAQLSAQTALDTQAMAGQTQLLGAQLGAQTQLQAQQMAGETQLAAAQLSAQTQLTGIGMQAQASVNLAQIQGQIQADIAQMNIQAQQQSQVFMANHDQMMEMQRQNGRVELANLDFGFRNFLMERGFQHDFDMSQMTQDQRIELQNLSHEQGLEQIGFQGDVQAYLNNQQIQGGFQTAALGGMLNILSAIGMSEADAAGQQAAIRNSFAAVNEILNLPFFSGMTPDSP